MIIAHFFLREIRKEPHLFVETTSSQGIEQPSPAAQMLIPVSYKERRQTWVKKAYYAFIEKFPGLVLVDAMENTLRLESDHPSFDLVFKPIERKRSLTEDIKESSNSSASEKEDKPVLTVIKNMFTKNKNME